jgi:hypothetical protein
MSYFLGVDTSSGKAGIPKELGWMEYSSPLLLPPGCFTVTSTLKLSYKMEDFASMALKCWSA